MAFALGIGLGIVGGRRASGNEAEAVRVDADIRQFVYGQYSTLPASRLDTENWLGIPRYTLTGETRLDFSMSSGPMRIVFHPRVESRVRRWEDGRWKGHRDADTEVRIQELRTAFAIDDEWFVSVGEECIQWGPSFLRSPSNPFSAAPFLFDPWRETPASMILRGQWVPSHSWSLMVLTEDRHIDASGFSRPRGYGAKASFLAGPVHAALIGSKREGVHPRWGAYLSGHAGEAWVLHAETGADRDAFSGTLGASFTTRGQWMLTTEYLHQSRGNRRDDLSVMVERRFPGLAAAAADVEPGGRPGEWSEEWGYLLPLRKNYLMVQAVHPQWRKRVEVLLRYEHGLDDASGRLFVYAAREARGWLRFFASGSAYLGGPETEFGSVLQHQLWVGTEWVFR